MKTAMRLAFRAEGNKWVAYVALPNTMKDATWLASIDIGLVHNEERRKAFIEIMKSAMAEFLNGLDMPVQSWDEQRAPESERSGSA